MNEKLWTRDFTIITLGSVVSMLGSAISGFGISLLVLDYSKSTFLYVLFMVVYNLPRVVMPLVAGPFLDRYSRKKVIYSLDFLSTVLYISFFFIVRGGFFNYGTLLIFSLILGTSDSIYSVAYESFYPTLIAKGNFSKAYSIASLIFPLSALMSPVAAVLYDKIGLAPIFAFNAITFFIAAVFETQIKAKETHISQIKEKFSVSQYKSDFIDGLSYIKAEKGLAVIVAYFSINMFTSSAYGALQLPYFKATPSLGLWGFSSVVMYTVVAGAGVLGRVVGGAIHYKFKYPVNKKFIIALFVYIMFTFFDGAMLYFPVIVMIIISFIVGMMGVTSYNIRISATQSYVPDNRRARFNGTFSMMCTFFGIIGQLLVGALADAIDIRIVIVIFNSINMIAIYFTMYRGREYVKPIYNR
ncbi:MAG: MFS transporter, partial [Clostridia bacterium]